MAMTFPPCRLTTWTNLSVPKLYVHRSISRPRLPLLVLVVTSGSASWRVGGPHLAKRSSLASPTDTIPPSHRIESAAATDDASPRRLVKSRRATVLRGMRFHPGPASHRG